VFSVLATDRGPAPPVNFQAGMQQPGILQPAEADSTSIGRRRPRFTEVWGRAGKTGIYTFAVGQNPKPMDGAAR
jgi:hypothetical protein